MEFTIEELFTLEYALEYAIGQRARELADFSKAGVECNALVRNMYEEGKLYKKLKESHR